MGQSYDGAGNMRGCRKGLKTLIQNDYPTALYIWYKAHRFSLVVEETVKNCHPVRDFFSILDELFVFMHWSHKRHGTFVEVMNRSKVENLKSKSFSKQRLKRIRTTRWGSKYEACKTLKSCFIETLECLEIIKNDSETAPEFKTLASGLKTKMSSFNFVATLEICATVFDALAPTTTLLQGVIIDFGSANSIIGHTTRSLKALRSDDNSWKKLEENVTKLCLEYGIEKKEKCTSQKK